MRYEKGLGGPYRQIFADREETHRVFAQLAGVPAAGEPNSWPQRLYDAGTLARQLIGFDSFPAPHLRTNGLLLDVRRGCWPALMPRATSSPRTAWRADGAALQLVSGQRG